MFYSLPNDSILDQSRLKAFAGDYINVNKKLKFNLIWEELKKKKKEKRVVGKRENAVTSIFSFSHSVLCRLIYQGRQM